MMCFFRKVFRKASAGQYSSLAILAVARCTKVYYLVFGQELRVAGHGHGRQDTLHQLRVIGEPATRVL